ncbi:Protein CBG26608 [Caenorhabditis briggsae]|uniref:Uncharacterized protein n=2 Tax=Caenorhabditis briggsae TaxID=6238 RepID=A0AAE9J074_CAEBR|nr:Protein CBG26608 [Caenorhabditis briggsae]ULU13783.1 hypothetical protein L3Y34_016344 [Caenorhabditis briggsae]CAS00588.1 Protein CBG26608 [Caenorhabditis briggsae]
MKLHVAFCIFLAVIIPISALHSENELKELEAVLEKFQPEALEVLEELKKEQIEPLVPQNCGSKIRLKILGTCGEVTECKSGYLAPLACRTHLNEKVFQELCCPN